MITICALVIMALVVLMFMLFSRKREDRVDVAPKLISIKTTRGRLLVQNVTYHYTHTLFGIPYWHSVEQWHRSKDGEKWGSPTWDGLP